MPASDPLRSVTSYYDECWGDYRWLWQSETDRALHFGVWDEDTRTHGDSLLKTNELVAKHAGLRPGSVVLDAGCGVAGTAMWLADRCGAKVAAVNVTSSQLVRALDYVAARGLRDSVYLSRQDYGRLAFADGSFDAVVAIESFCHAPDKRVFLGEAHRVLKPGGRLVVFDGFRPPRAVSPGAESFIGAWLSGWMIPGLARSDEMTRWADELGFEDAVLEDITDRVRPSLRRLFAIASLAYPFAATLHRLGLRTDVQHGNVLAARRQWQASRRGLWIYGVFAASKRRYAARAQ